MDDNVLRMRLAPLEPLLADPEVQEILVDAPDRVLVERGGRLETSAVTFESPEAVRSALEAALALGGAAFEPGQTVADTRLADGTRVLGVLPPTAVGGPYLVLRKFYTRAMTWEQLFSYGSLTRDGYELLLSAVRASVNVLVTGGNGSGKTTILNLLAESAPAHERLVVVGDAEELPVTHPRRIHLASGANLSASDLLSTAAKMRPDWIVFGELRGAEALLLLQAFSLGVAGMASLQATSVAGALARLEALCLMANLGLGLAEIRAQIVSAFRLITCQRRFPNGGRRLIEITELLGLEDGRYVLQPLMRANAESGQLERTPAQPSWGLGR
jgi:pilus assembly protein CpaF